MCDNSEENAAKKIKLTEVETVKESIDTAVMPEDTSKTDDTLPQLSTKDPRRCQHWVLRKKRFCKMTVGKNKRYCGEHSIAEPDSVDSTNRVVCPNDPKHTVDKRNLEKHLRICNAKEPVEVPVYIKPRVNVLEEPSKDDETNFKLKDVPQDELDAVVKIVNEFFEKHLAGSIENNFRDHKVLAEELANETYGTEKRKHLLQTSSILGILDQEGFLAPKTCFIEYGAGKAALTFWLATAVRDVEGAKVLVVDRASHRHKKDNLITDREFVERIRADIADLDLSGVEMLKKCESIVGLSKHLCGGATDLALRCMVLGNQNSVKSSGFLICVCCHHQCTWNTFLGRDFFIANGIDRKTFDIIIKLVSWYTCGDGLSRDKRSTFKDAEREKREEIGWRCKRILDKGRLEYMISQGYDARMCFYAEKSVTLENVCIIGKLKD